MQDSVPTIDSGDTAWMIVATALVLLMTLPGLALLYAGMVRVKNALSILMQCFAIAALVSVLWVIYGYSLAFDATGTFVGGFSKAFMADITGHPSPERFRNGPRLPDDICIITPALTVGAARSSSRAHPHCALVYVHLAPSRTWSGAGPARCSGSACSILRAVVAHRHWHQASRLRS